MKKTSYTGALLFVLATFMGAREVLAQTGYKLLEPLPGLGKTAPLDPGALSGYLQTLFNLSIGIAIALSVVMIVIGGAQYISTDSLYGQQGGKEKLTNAVWGLVLALGTFLILYTINPNILKLNLTIGKLQQQKIGTTKLERTLTEGELTSTPGGAITGVDPRFAQIQRNESEIRSTLLANGVSVNKSACTKPGDSNCTNVGGLPPIAVERLSTLKFSCPGCTIRVTGGTEYWLHSPSTKHGPGNAVVDLSADPALNEYLTGSFNNPASGVRIAKNRVLFTFETTGDNGASTGPHWHVVLNYQ